MTSRVLKFSIPWVAAVIILVYLFQAYPIERLTQALPYVRVVPFLAFSVLYFFFMWLADCWGLAQLFSSVGCPTHTRELMIPRLASYPITLVNYGVGQGVLAYFFKREKGLPFLKSGSLMAFTTAVDFYWMVTFAAIGTTFAGFTIAGLELEKTIWGIWVITTIGLFGLAVLSRTLRSRHLFFAFREAGFRDFLKALALRLPLHLGVNTTLYFVAKTFGASIPFFTVLTYLPVIILASTIPITPGGLGTLQILSIQFFKESIRGDLLDQGVISAEELLLLITLSFQGLNYLLKIACGLPFLRRAFLGVSRPVTILPLDFRGAD